jgi:hypothetical protein
MHRGAVLHILPWLLLTLALAVALRWLARLAGGRWQAARLRELPADETGAVQTLSFVLTLPIFVMAMMLIVQTSQVMLAQMVVEYAAYATARSTMVWIPAATPALASATTLYEGPNCISSFVTQPDPVAGVRYVIQPGSPKYARIQQAAILACAPISPSRDIPGLNTTSVAGLAAAAQYAYSQLAPATYAANSRISQRLANKLAYSMAATNIQLSFVHSTADPPLQTWLIGPDLGENYPNEVGWQDAVTATVTHQLALLPGPGRLLFSSTPYSPTGTGVGVDQVAASIQQNGSLYTYTLTAAATLMIDGEKPTWDYVYTP